MNIESLSNPEAYDLTLCVWSDIKKNDVDTLQACYNPSETRSLLIELMCPPEVPHSHILGDMYFSCYKYAQTHKFTPPQLSSLLTILKRTHDVCVSTPFGNFQKCHEFFKELLLLHVVHRPPWTLKIFDAHQVQGINDYIIDNYFRHFKMYKYAFTAKIKLDLSLKYHGIPAIPGIVFDEVDLETKPLDFQENEDEQPKIENIEAENELEQIIKQAITEQLKNLTADVDRQLEEADKTVCEKLKNYYGVNEDEQDSGKSKSPAKGAKGKKR